MPHAPTFDLAISRASARAAPTGRRIGGRRRRGWTRTPMRWRASARAWFRGERRECRLPRMTSALSTLHTFWPRPNLASALARQILPDLFPRGHCERRRGRARAPHSRRPHSTRASLVNAQRTRDGERTRTKTSAERPRGRHVRERRGVSREKVDISVLGCRLYRPRPRREGRRE